MKKPTPQLPDNQGVVPTVVATQATPDNTPIPGGGSWRWDAALAGWVSNEIAPQTTAPE